MGKARRAKGTGSIFCKPNGRYGYRFTDPAGKIRSQGLFAEDGKPITNKEAAIEAVKKIVPSIQEAARLTSKLEYLTKAAELKNLISPIHISVADMWTAYENSPYRPDSSSATMDFTMMPFYLSRNGSACFILKSKRYGMLPKSSPSSMPFTFGRAESVNVPTMDASPL